MAETKPIQAGRLLCVVVTPEVTVLETQADFIVVPLYDGELGVAPLHTPLLGRLGYGELRLRQGNSMLRYYVDGGFVEVAKDVVTILTPRAVPAEKLDGAVIREQLAAAQKKPAHTTELREIRDRAVAQSRAQLQVQQRS